MLAFIDVAGDPYSSPENSPWIAIGIVCIRKRSLYDITNNFFRLKRDILNNEYCEVKSTNLLNRSTLSHPDMQKVKFLERVVSDCIDHCDCLFASIAFENLGNNQKSDENHLPKHYRDALWRIEAVARKWHTEDTVVIIDNNARQADRKLAFAFNNYIYRSRSGDELNHILPVPIFADSITTPGIQLADIVAGIVRNYHARHAYEEKLQEEPWLNYLVTYHKIINDRSLSSYRVGDYVIRGMYVPKHYNI